MFITYKIPNLNKMNKLKCMILQNTKNAWKGFHVTAIEKKLSKLFRLYLVVMMYVV